MAQRPQLLDRLRERARELGSRAVDEMLSSPARADKVGDAVRRAQHLRDAFDERGARLLAALGLATQNDLERVTRKVGRLRKRLQGILERLD